MIRKIMKPMKWLLGLFLLWLFFLLASILNFPNGELSDAADAAIVLGAAVDNDKPSPVFAERINHAINLYHAGKVNRLIFTGGIGESQKFAEATVARDYAIDKKVENQDIFIETESLTTQQNIANAQQIVNQQKFTKVLLISDGLHLTRAIAMANDLGLNAKASATPTSRYQSLKTKLPFALRELYFYHHYCLFGE